MARGIHRQMMGRANLAFLSVGLAIAAGGPASAGSTTPPQTMEEMWQIIQQQNAKIDAQNDEIKKLKADQAATDAKVEATGDLVEQVAVDGGGEPGWWDRTSVGGYGELHYEGGDKQEVDFHRFVLFFGHEFTDDIRLFTELELEHALADDSGLGEVELEQAYVQFDIGDETQINAGVQLLPLGILNETHEPPTFFGVERNIVENMIIPTTWWEAGAGIHGYAGPAGLSYDVVFHSGLEVPTAGGSAFTIRSGRNKVARAAAEDGAITGRLKYTGIPGVELAVSGQYQFDVTQGAGDPMSGDGVPGLLLTAHADARYEGFGLRALYAQWWLDGDTPEALGKDEQYGFYIEPSYRFPVAFDDRDFGELGIFGRYTMVDTFAGNSLDTGIHRYTAGFNYWPHPDVVFKMDWYREEDDAADTNEDRLNVGFGYQF